MSIDLETKRADITPKCATCQWWRGRALAAGQCTQWDIKTLDLALCSAWADADIVQEILSPEDD